MSGLYKEKFLSKKLSFWPLAVIRGNVPKILRNFAFLWKEIFPNNS